MKYLISFNSNKYGIGIVMQFDAIYFLHLPILVINYLTNKHHKINSTHYKGAELRAKM